MLNRVVTEEEIEAAERLSKQGEFAAALALAQSMLKRAQDDETRMRLLFNIVGCATQLNLTDVTDESIQALEQLPNPKESRAFVDLLQIMAYIELGRAQEALDLIHINLKSEFAENPEFRDWKYAILVHKGQALTRLARCDEALSAFNEAQAIYPNGEYETDMLISRSNCLTALGRYDEAYDKASQVLARGNEEMATLAMQYMADCRMWQGKVQESLELYRDLLKRLPCRLVQEEQVQAGIRNGMAYLEKFRSQVEPF